MKKKLIQDLMLKWANSPWMEFREEVEKLYDLAFEEGYRSGVIKAGNELLAGLRGEPFLEETKNDLTPPEEEPIFVTPTEGS